MDKASSWTHRNLYCIGLRLLVMTGCPDCILTHWGRVTHICVDEVIIIASDNGLSPDRRQAIIWTNAGLLSIEPLRTYFSENLIKIQPFSLKKMHVKMSSAKWRPSWCLNVLCQRHFQMHFRQWYWVILIEMSPNLVLWGHTEGKPVSGSELVPDNLQSINGINGDPLHWPKYASSGFSESKHARCLSTQM